MQLVDADRLADPEAAAMDAARAVVEAGGRALIVASGEKAVRARVAGAETLVFQPDAGPLRRSRSAAALAEVLARHEPDILHARSADMAAVAKPAAVALGARCASSLHRAPSGGWLSGAGEKALLSADKVIAVSDFVAGQAGGAIVISPGADMDVFAEEVVPPTRTIKTAADWGLEEDTRPILLAPAPLGDGDGVEVLVAAVAELAKSRDDFLCLVAGAADPEAASAAEAAILKAGLAGAMRLAPPAEDAPAGLKLAAVVVSAETAPPSDGRRLIEAQAMGRPVVAPDHGAMREVVGHGETGWLTPPGDAAALAAALDEALSIDDSQRAHIGMAGRARVRARFTKAAGLDATLRIYEELAGRLFRATV